MAVDYILEIRGGLRGICLTLALVGFHAVSFLALLSISIGLGTLISVCYELIFGIKMNVEISSMLSLTFLAAFSQGSVWILYDSKPGKWLRSKKKAHPIALVKVPIILFTILFLFAIGELYDQYMNKRKAADVSESASKIPTMIFLLSQSFITYIISKENDWSTYFWRISEIDRNRLYYLRAGKLFSYIFFGIIQAVLIFIYGIPLLVIVVVVDLYSDLSSCTIFIILIITAALIGAGVVEFENKSPFPVLPLKAPSYNYEAHLCSRSMFTIAMHVIIVIFFFRVPTTLACPKQGDEYFYTFAVAISLTLIQDTKIMLNKLKMTEAWNRQEVQASAARRADFESHIIDGHGNGKDEIREQNETENLSESSMSMECFSVVEDEKKLGCCEVGNALTGITLPENHESNYNNHRPNDQQNSRSRSMEAIQVGEVITCMCD